MCLNDAGRMVHLAWNELRKHYPGVEIDAFIAMPNHVHGIVILVGAGPRACPDCGRFNKGQPQGVAPTGALSLPDVMHRFKTLTTTRYRNGVMKNGWRPFAGKLWQRTYYEHVIRHDDDLNRIQEYIVNNTAQWALDEENPDCVEHDSKNFPKTGQTFYVGALLAAP